MIRFKHWSMAEMLPEEVEGVQFQHFSFNMIPDRFTQFIDGTLQELVKADFGNLTACPDLVGLFNLRIVELGDEITELPSGCFMFAGNYNEDVERIIFPPNLKSIHSEAFTFSLRTHLAVYDFSKAKIIPTLGYQTTEEGIHDPGISYSPGVTRIEVPAALYQQWCETDGWRQIKDDIYAV